MQLPAPTLPADPRLTELPAEEPCFRIATVGLDGARKQEFAWLQDYLSRHRGGCIGREGINLLVKRATALLIERGFVTSRIGIPEQDLSSGHLSLVLVPGVIREVRFVDPSTATSWRTAFPARPGDLLNLRDLEQGLEQLKRVPSQDADMQIVPGERPGESDIVITIKTGKPWHVTASLDDAGAKPTGKLQASINLSLDNLLGLNDLLSIGLNSDAQRDGGMRGTKGDNFSYSLPWGYWTASLAASRYDYRQTVRGVSQSFVSSGRSEQTEFKLNRVIHRDQESKSSLQARLIRRHAKSFLDDVEIEVQRRDTTAAELAFIHRQYLGAAQIDATLAHKEGVPWFGGQRDPENRLAQAPTYRYALQTIDLAASLPFAVGRQSWRWLSAFRGQATHSPLFASEFFAIGNRNTVRGFDGEQTLAAERGWYWRNELETTLAQGLAAYAACDFGKVGGPTAGTLIGQHLAGIALGIRGGVAGLAYDAFVSRAVRKPDGFATVQPALGVQLSSQF